MLSEEGRDNENVLIRTSLLLLGCTARLHVYMQEYFTLSTFYFSYILVIYLFPIFLIQLFLLIFFFNCVCLG